MAHVEIISPAEVTVAIEPQAQIEVAVEAQPSVEVVIQPGAATYRPIRTTVRGFIAAEPISALRAVVLNLNGTISLASASNPTHSNRVKGISITAANTGQPVDVLEAGPYTDNSWDWGLNQAVFLVEAGGLSVTPPVNGFYLQIGQSETPDTLYVEIQRPILIS